ncbi:MAG: ribonuclease HII [Candidatus Pacearchaeota archaeon]
MLVLGIDDAGRGPVIGPMVLAGVLIKKETEREFMKIGIKDSKLLSHKKRKVLSEEIKKLSVSYHEVLISVDEIDNKDKENLNLNQREAVASATIINKVLKSLKSKEKIEVIIDCPSTNIESWKSYLENFIIGKANLHLICEHKADVNHIVVSAASIIAKVRRDQEIDKIKSIVGVDFGSGYSADPVTRKFIYDNYDKYKNKGIFRESWDTIKKHKNQGKQKTLF